MIDDSMAATAKVYRLDRSYIDRWAIPSCKRALFSFLLLGIYYILKFSGH